MCVRAGIKLPFFDFLGKARYFPLFQFLLQKQGWQLILWDGMGTLGAGLSLQMGTHRPAQGLTQAPQDGCAQRDGDIWSASDWDQATERGRE